MAAAANRSMAVKPAPGQRLDAACQQDRHAVAGRPPPPRRCKAPSETVRGVVRGRSARASAEAQPPLGVGALNSRRRQALRQAALGAAGRSRMASGWDDAAPQSGPPRQTGQAMRMCSPRGGKGSGPGRRPAHEAYTAGWRQSRDAPLGATNTTMLPKGFGDRKRSGRRHRPIRGFQSGTA